MIMLATRGGSRILEWEGHWSIEAPQAPRGVGFDSI